MILLKIVKIKMIMGMLALSSLCLGQDLNSKECNDLLIAVTQCDFNKFDKLYSVNNLSENEKKELQEIAQNIIEGIANKWPTGFFYGKSISNMSVKRLNNLNKRLWRVVWVTMIINPLLSSLILLYPYLKTRYYSAILKQLQRNILTPINCTAAQAARLISSNKNNWLSLIKGYLVGNILGQMILALFWAWHLKKINRLLLIYKRWKDVIEIKRLLESSSNAVVLS